MSDDQSAKGKAILRSAGVTSDGNELSEPTVESLGDARRWIGILHRRSVQDAQRMDRIEERLARPWWRRRRA